MLSEFYYSNLYMEKHKMASAQILILVVPFYAWLTTYGMLYQCRFTNSRIELMRQLTHKMALSIPYSEIERIELFVVRRKWPGGSLLSMMIPYYNMDLIVHIRGQRRNEKRIEIEFPATYAFREIIELLKNSHIFVDDVFGLFRRFQSSEDFKEGYAAYFDKNYDSLAYEYGLDNPRIDFSGPQEL